MNKINFMIVDFFNILIITIQRVRFASFQLINANRAIYKKIVYHVLKTLNVMILKKLINLNSINIIGAVIY